MFKKTDLSVSDFLKIIFSSLLIVSLSIPAIFSGASESSNAEKRELQSKPEFNFSKEYFLDFEMYLSDNFGFRASLIEVGSRYKLKYFKSSNRPQNVSVGNSGFIFFNIPHVYNSFSNSNLLTVEEGLDFKNQFEKLKKHADKNEYKLIYAFWPNKQTIYPEKLSPAISRVKKDTISLADQLIDLHSQLQQELIDVREVLLDLKMKDTTNGNLQPYWRLDTHWNDLGAYFGYKTLMEASFPTLGISPYPLDSLETSMTKRAHGDLTGNLGFQDRIIKSYREKYLSIKPKEAIRNHIKEHHKLADEFGNKAAMMVNEKIQDGSTLVIYGDSYSIPLRRHFFSLHFHKVYHLRGRVDLTLMEKIKPDAVMICRVEKGLKNEYLK